MNSILSNKQTEAQLNNLLDVAMIPKQTVEEEKKYKRRQSRSLSIAVAAAVSGSNRKRSLGALRYADNGLSTVNEDDFSNNWKGVHSRKSIYSTYDEDEIDLTNQAVFKSEPAEINEQKTKF